jgi:hypothetical protein
MLDIVARILPVAATVAVASLAVFNVGYFWKIGLHFLGTVDFNNIVYSFGLTIGLWMVLIFIGLKWVDILSGPVSGRSTQRSMRTSTVVMWIGIAVFLLASFLHEPLISNIVRAGLILAGAILCWGAWSVQSFLHYKTSGSGKAQDFVSLGLASFVIFFQAGTFVAEWEMINDDTYTIATIKGASIENVRLLRASSAGFIFFAEERIVFIPQSQIAQIKATPKWIPKPANRPCLWGYTAAGRDCIRIDD